MAHERAVLSSPFPSPFLPLPPTTRGVANVARRSACRPSIPLGSSDRGRRVDADAGYGLRILFPRVRRRSSAACRGRSTPCSTASSRPPEEVLAARSWSSPSCTAPHSRRRLCAARCDASSPPPSIATLRSCIACHSSGSPLDVWAEHSRTCGTQHCSLARIRREALLYSAAARPAAPLSSPSALFTTIKSANSTIPLLTPCRPSPPAGGSTSSMQSTTSITAVSDCPTPTVSTRTHSCPAASQRRAASAVLRAIPPSVPRVEVGLT
mmetsp:Transcript_62003/g.195999  ORF Transcript_62003/g.195999 Transcript_62003/m.195999 type:complete len:267 (+) Transcript_62003:577-1377(+)